MILDILLYVEENISDTDLSFNDYYIPEHLERIFNNLDSINQVFISLPSAYSGKLSSHNNAIIRPGQDDAVFWKNLFEKTKSEHIIKILADAPFIDNSIIKEMADIHCNYLAEFTYSENLPEGLGCEIFSKDLINALPDFDEKTLPLSQIIKSNINNFDIELYYKDPDLRDKRLSFRSSSKRDKLVMENIISVAGSIPSYEDIRPLIAKNPQVLYLGPSYLEVELTGRCDLDCIYCYRNHMGGNRNDMAIETFTKIITDMRSFQLPYSLCLGGSGEPAMHPNFYTILEQALAEELIERIIIETSGIHLDANYRNFTEKDFNGKIATIINCSGHDSATYSTLHGTDHFDTVHQNILALKECLADKRDNALYIQIMKINETEPFLDTYYDFWENHKVPVILQKQNTFLGLIKDRRYSDLSPLERIPCWHLQRDLFITATGEVAFCKVDVKCENSRGNVSSESLKDIWAKGKESFLNDYSGKLAARPNCRACDEWYTFNF